MPISLSVFLSLVFYHTPTCDVMFVCVCNYLVCLWCAHMYDVYVEC